MTPARRRLAALLLTLGALRFAHWGASLTGDEAHMLRYYASKPASVIVSTYDAPNNHILLSLLLRGLDRLSPKTLILTLADHRPLQLPGLLASLACLPLAYAVAASALPASAAATALLLLGLSFWPLSYAHMLRGYGLSAFLVLLAAWAARQGSRRGLAAFAAASFLAHYTIPVNAAYTAAVALWAFLLRRSARERAELCAAYAAALLATWLAYRPVAAQMAAALRTMQSPAGAGPAARLGEWFSALGHAPAFGAFALLLAALGAAWALRRGGRTRSLALLGALLLLTPLAASFAQGTVLPARAYVPALAGWAWLAALGAHGLRVLARSRGRRLAWGLAAALLALASAGEVRAFLACNRGLDARRAMLAANALTRESDDYAVIHTQPGEFFDPLSWGYYGFAAGIEPYFHLFPDRDYAHMSRRRYVLLAGDEASARAAAERSGVDPILLARMKPAGREGRVGLWTIDLDEEALAAFRAAAASKVPAERARGLYHLAFDAVSAGRVSEAVPLLEKALAAAPNDGRARWLQAWTDYLSFADAQAEAGLRWVAAHDPANVHAPLYLADLLADRGRDAEALAAYRWYLETGEAGAWYLKDRAVAGAKALREGRGKVRSPAAGGPVDWTAAAKAYYYKGSLERAAVAMTMALKEDPKLDRWLRVAELREKLHEHAQAALLRRRALEATGDAAARLGLAKSLVLKRRFEEAGALLDGAPAGPQTDTLARLVRREGD